jgi:predicted nucleotidyltransferase
MLYTVDEIKKLVEPVAKRYKVDRMWLFGSYARNEATSESDIDFLVDAAEIRTLFKLAGLYRELEEVFGLKLDLLTIEAMEDEFREFIAKDEILIYEQQP